MKFESHSTGLSWIRDDRNTNAVQRLLLGKPAIKTSQIYGYATLGYVRQIYAGLVALFGHDESRPTMSGTVHEICAVI